MIKGRDGIFEAKADLIVECVNFLKNILILIKTKSGLFGSCAHSLLTCITSLVSCFDSFDVGNQVAPESCGSPKPIPNPLAPLFPAFRIWLHRDNLPVELIIL